MRLFEAKIDFAHAATFSIRVAIFQRANSGSNSDRVKNPMHGNAPGEVLVNPWLVPSTRKAQG